MSVLTGSALRRAFLKQVHPGAIGVDGGPLGGVNNNSSTKAFFDGPSLPRIDLVSPAEQAMVAMKLFHGRGARFDASDSNLPVFCTIDGVMALGWDHFKAAMRALLLAELKREAGK